MKPKQGTPPWISGGFLGKGYTLQESSGKKSPAGWHCTKGKVYPQPTPPHPPPPEDQGPLAPPSAFPTLLSSQGLTDPPGPQRSPLPPPGPGTGVSAGGTSLPLPHSWEHGDQTWGRGGRANRSKKTSPTFSPASCWSGRTSPRAPAGPPWPERKRKCRKDHKGSQERAELPAGLGASLSIARSGPCDSSLSTRRWDSVAPDVPGP